MPASERQIRGWAVDLLIVDEAAFLDDDLLHGAAMPTTAARPHARIVLASSPWSDSGPFWQAAAAGMAGTDPHTRTVRWSLRDAPWISTEAVEAARASMSELRFRAEYEGEFVGSADRFFPPGELRAAVAGYALGGPAPGAVAGLDWGRAYDAHAVVVAAQLVDWGVNGEPVAFLPWLEASRRPYADQVAEVVSVARWLRLRRLASETNGVGAYPTEDVTTRLRGRGVLVEAVATSQRSKEDAYGRVRALLSAGRLVLPDDPELLRQLGGIVGSATPAGGLSIAAASPALHDDLPDALSLAAARLDLRAQREVEPPEGVEWLETGSGVRVPADPTGRAVATSSLSWARGRLPDALAGASLAGRVLGEMQRRPARGPTLPTGAGSALGGRDRWR